MSRVCELSGKGPMSGNSVSHANNKTRRRFLPNLNDVTLISDVLGQSFKLRVSAAALRTVDHRGGLDAFLTKAKDDELSVNARNRQGSGRRLIFRVACHSRPRLCIRRGLLALPQGRVGATGLARPLVNLSPVARLRPMRQWSCLGSAPRATVPLLHARQVPR